MLNYRQLLAIKAVSITLSQYVHFLIFVYKHFGLGNLIHKLFGKI